MGLNFRDVEGMNSAIKDLGDSLLKERMMKQENSLRQQEIARQAQRDQNEADLRGQMLGVDKERFTATQAHWKKMEDEAKLHQSFLGVVQSGKDIKEGMAHLGQQVAAGTIAPEDATDYFKAAVDSMPADAKPQMLTNPFMKAMYEGKGDWTQIGAQAKDNQPKPFTTVLPNGKEITGIYNPRTGAYQIPGTDKLPEIDRMRLNSLMQQHRAAQASYLRASGTPGTDPRSLEGLRQAHNAAGKAVEDFINSRQTATPVTKHFKATANGDDYDLNEIGGKQTAPQDEPPLE